MGRFRPLYNSYLTLKISGRPGWWLILFFIPIVNIIVAIIVYIDLAKSFGKGTGYGLALIILGFIFIPILALSDARYVGPAGGGGRSSPGYPPPDTRRAADSGAHPASRPGSSSNP